MAARNSSAGRALGMGGDYNAPPASTAGTVCPARPHPLAPSPLRGEGEPIWATLPDSTIVDLWALPLPEVERDRGGGFGGQDAPEGTVWMAPNTKGRPLGRPPSVPSGPSSLLRRGLAARAAQLVVDHGGDVVERHGAVDEPAVDEHRRGAADAGRRAGLDVGLDGRGLLAGIEALVELVGVQAQRGGLGLELVDAELALVAEHRVVQLPELALIKGAEGGLGRLLGVLVERQRVLAEDQAHLVAVLLLDSLEGRGQARAEGALEVRELDDGHRGVLRALGRTGGGDVDPDRLELVVDLVLGLQGLEVLAAGLLLALLLEVGLDLGRDLVLRAGDLGLVLLVEGVHVRVGHRGGLDLGEELVLGRLAGGGFRLQHTVLDGLIQAVLQELMDVLLVLPVERLELLRVLGADVRLGDRLAVDDGEHLVRARAGGGGLLLRTGRQDAQGGDEHERTRDQLFTKYIHESHSFVVDGASEAANRSRPGQIPMGSKKRRVILAHYSPNPHPPAPSPVPSHLPHRERGRKSPLLR